MTMVCKRCGQVINQGMQFLKHLSGGYEHYKQCPSEEAEEDRTFPVVEGVSPNQSIVTNEKGGSQSKVLYRFDLLDPQAMFAMTKVLEEGTKKYDPWNWRKIDIEDHLNHALIHIYAWLAGDRSDDHLSHLMCRSMFAVGVDKEDRP